MYRHGIVRSVGVALFVVVVPAAAFAQTIGTFRWQLLPYCNVVTLTVTQHGGVFTLDGFDDQCGANERASVTGAAFPNPNGTIGMGLSIVLAPSGTPLHVDAALSLASIAGPWRDSAGASGMLAFAPTAAGGTPRPVPVTAFPAGLSATGHTIVQVAAPVNPSDAATKEYVDASVPPPSRFRFLPDGGFVAAGDLAVGTIPATGRGTRLMWHPNKAAIRAGDVHNDEWDDANVGRYSAAFGDTTVASGIYSFAAGSGTRAIDSGTVALGIDSEARGQTAFAMGFRTAACGQSSVAFGILAVTATAPSSLAPCSGTLHKGAFIFSSTGPSSYFTTVADGEFAARAVGGFRFRTNGQATTGCNLPAGSGAFACSSDANLKRDFRPLNGDDVLSKLARVDVATWSFADEPAVRHAGPTAQDFHAAFGLGANDTFISYTDINGINMRAIQALEARTRREREQAVQERDELKAELAALRALIAELMARER